MLRAQPVVYCDGNRPDDVLAVITDVYSAELGADTPPDLLDQVRASYLDRAKFVAGKHNS